MSEHEQPNPRELRWGWFSVGDLISICTGLILVGMMYGKVQTHDDAIKALQAQTAYGQQQANLYVRKDDYREDIREIKTLLRDLNAKLDSKADRP